MLKAIGAAADTVEKFAQGTGYLADAYCEITKGAQRKAQLTARRWELEDQAEIEKLEKALEKKNDQPATIEHQPQQPEQQQQA